MDEGCDFRISHLVQANGWVDFFVNLAVWVSVALADGAYMVRFWLYLCFCFALLGFTSIWDLHLLVFLHGSHGDKCLRHTSFSSCRS